MSERKITYVKLSKIFPRFRWIGIGIGNGDADKWYDKALVIGLFKWLITVGPSYKD